MIVPGTHAGNPTKIVLIGNHLPRQCGIATFTTDLLTALAEENPAAECWAVAINDTPKGYAYPSQVRFEINQRALEDYKLAADFLNINRVEVVCLQHEYGIFGGNYGMHILDLLSNLRMPLVTTLHTLLEVPSPEQLTITKRIAQLSDHLVVMSRKAEEILREVYGVSADKITMIHHGIPDVPFVDPNYYKDQFGVEGRKVILTFGLLSPGKGIETMVDALPSVVREHPEVAYVVVGATHPHVKKAQGESYRLSLQQRARELGVGEHLIFHNRFVDVTELCEFLGAADLYVTPYLNREQIVSGTLAYALGAGKATISTPYWHAEEMLAEGRGRIVPFGDTKALARQVKELLAHEVERHAMRKRAYTYCREMIWKEVARKYLQVFSAAKMERESGPRVIFQAKTVEAIPYEMPQPKLDHIIRLTDDVGILQHAKFIIPDRYHGYCTDDNARALFAVLLAQDFITDSKTINSLACTYASFLCHAFNKNTGQFRNFMGYDRHWLEETGSEDSHGRSLWSLGESAVLAKSSDIRDALLVLFEKTLPVLLNFSSPRSWAFALMGIHAYLKKFSGDSGTRRLREKLTNQLFQLYQNNVSPDWPWIEETVTYANGKISQALIASGHDLQREDVLQAGLHSLQWLMNIQTDPKGHFVPIGNNRWYCRGGNKARFDQQPIEALHMIEACREAYHATGDSGWIEHAQRCLGWFLGQNDLSMALYDHNSGGCRDGLGADGPNRNQGAESTLVWFLSLLNLLRLRSMKVSLETSTEPASSHNSREKINVN